MLFEITNYNKLQTAFILIFLWTGFAGTSQLHAQENYQQRFEVNLGGTFLLHYDAGWGISSNARLFLPLKNKNKEVTLGIIYDKLFETGYYNDNQYTLYSIAGSYRKTTGDFFIGPQAGAGIYSEDEYKYKALNFFIGLESGFRTDKMTYLFDYRFNAADGFLFREQFHLFSLKAGRRF